MDRVFLPGDYLFYDSKLAVAPAELIDLYRFTHWGKSRTLEQIDRMLQGSSLCFSVRHNDRLVAFCRILTDFVFRASLWDILVHPDHQGRGLGTALMRYTLDHPAVKPIPLIVTYSSDLIPFLKRLGFASNEGNLQLLRVPIEYS
ncbi:MAG: GNAT family N-acetyltransferase [Synergistales bacterium]|nr:GNAT family N-acetyltransferase [Synergistales bacterium]